MVDDSPQLQIANISGLHNTDLAKSTSRLTVSKSYEDLSTVCIIPNNGFISAPVTERWLGQVSQMNQKFLRLMMIGLEKYHAFNLAIEQILANPTLQNFKYILTLEEDVLIPPDGLIKLFESMNKFDVVGALAWTPGIEGKPMIYGSPFSMPQNITQTIAIPNNIQECIGLGTGYTLFKLDIFRDSRIPKPWFRSNMFTSNERLRYAQPDMYFFENIHKLGYKVACDTRVRIGKFDIKDNIVW